MFASACHTRFEHSIGVSYLAGVFIEQLRLRQPELEITDVEVPDSYIACSMLHSKCKMEITDL